MCSFYHLPSTVIGNDKHKTLFAAYSYYNVRVRSRAAETRHTLSGCRLRQVATSVSITELMRDALVLARDCNMDVFNALNVMVRGVRAGAVRGGAVRGGAVRAGAVRKAQCARAQCARAQCARAQCARGRP